MKDGYDMCFRCEQRKKDVRLRIDPYDKEINDEENKKLICDECEAELIQDI